VNDSGSYGAVRALAQYSGSPVKAARRWLETQDSFMLVKPVTIKFSHRKTFAKRIGNLFQANLVITKNWRRLTTSILSIHHHRRVFEVQLCCAVKERQGFTVSSAFEQIIANRSPNMLQTDCGLKLLNA
jgi:hypothetical protein